MSPRRPETRREVYVAAYTERYGVPPRDVPAQVTRPRGDVL